MDADEFRRRGHELIDWIADHVEGVGEHRVSPDIQPGAVRAALPGHPPGQPESWEAFRRDLDDVIVPGIVHWQHPSFFAYFPSNTSYPSILGELLCAGLGVQGMSWVTSPACTELETLMLDWMADLLDLPNQFRSTSPAGGGVIQGSASEAALVAILSARHRATHGAVNHDGDTTRLIAYATSHAHSSIEKGLRIAGIGTDRLRVVAHDRRLAMDPAALAATVKRDVAAGLVPFFACATRGTTSSLAFDPVVDIAPICREHGTWLHVDAAMSGIAALEPSYRWVNDGLGFADSYCTNAHKWMGVNFDCDLYWTADRGALLGALSILPEYLRSAAAATGAAIDYRDWQIPLGRRFRALKLWMTLRLDDLDATRAMIRRHVELTSRLATEVSKDERFEIVAESPLSLLVVRLAGPDGDARTDALIEAANATGQALFTRTVLDGRVALRFSIGATATQWEHVEAGWRLLQSLAAAPAVSAAGRSSS